MNGLLIGQMKSVNIMKEFIKKHKTFFFIFLFCASIIFYLGKKVQYKDSQIVKLNMELIKKDTLLELSAGKYRKIVDYYTSKKNLNNIVKDNSPKIYNEIKDKNEKILSNTNIGMTFKPKEGSQIIPIKNQEDSIYNFTSYYPEKDSSFIKFNGSLNTKSKKLDEKWSFNNVNINVILTQNELGLWNSYLDAPEFIKVNSMKINSLEPKEYIPTENKVKTFTFFGGLGVRTDIKDISTLNNKHVTLNGAISIKNKVLIDASVGTDNKVSTGILFKF